MCVTVCVSVCVSAPHAAVSSVAQSQRKMSRSGQFTVGERARGVGRETTGSWSKAERDLEIAKNENEVK